MKPIRIILAAAVGLLLVATGATQAPAAWPEREIRLIVPYKAGGQSDLTARKLAEIIQKRKLLTQPVIVVNIPGANTQEGLRAAMQAKPDGYTLLLHHSAFVTMKALGQIPMNWRDMEMIGQALEMGNSLVVNKDAPFATAEEFIGAVQANPGKYRIAIPGLGGVAHLALLDVLARKGVLDKVEIIPFDGANEAVTALMGGRVDMRTAPNTDMARFVKSGDQRALLVMGNDRLDGVDVAQYAPDLGLENALVLRNGIFAPSGLPEEVRAQLATALRQAVESEDFQQFAAQQAAKGRFLDAAQWAKVFEDDEKLVDSIVSHIVKK